VEMFNRCIAALVWAIRALFREVTLLVCFMGSILSLARSDLRIQAMPLSPEVGSGPQRQTNAMGVNPSIFTLLSLASPSPGGDRWAAAHKDAPRPCESHREDSPYLFSFRRDARGVSGPSREPWAARSCLRLPAEQPAWQ
jgi:hypothetical protein